MANFTDEKGIKVVDTSNKSPEDISTEIRDLFSTGSRETSINFGKPSNYQNSYQIVQRNNRTDNNKYLVLNDGNQIHSESHNIEGSEIFADTNVENRPIQKSVFVQRFSSPGGPETQAELTQNEESAEYSAYNSVNFRNLLARNKYNEWSSQSSSLSEDFPSFHKVPKNPFYKQDPNAFFAGSASADDTFTDIIEYDNLFIQHQIPRSDKQVSWIKNSLQKEFIYEPQYRTFENEQLYGNILQFYNTEKIDEKRFLAVYLRSPGLYVGYFEAVLSGREKALKLINEFKVDSNQLTNPVLRLASRDNQIIYAVLAGVYTNLDWTNNDVDIPYAMYNSFKLDLSTNEFTVGQIQKTEESFIPVAFSSTNIRNTVNQKNFSFERIKENFFAFVSVALRGKDSPPESGFNYWAEGDPRNTSAFYGPIVIAKLDTDQLYLQTQLDGFLLTASVVEQGIPATFFENIEGEYVNQYFNRHGVPTVLPVSDDKFIVSLNLDRSKPSWIGDEEHNLLPNYQIFIPISFSIDETHNVNPPYGEYYPPQPGFFITSSGMTEEGFEENVSKLDYTMIHPQFNYLGVSGSDTYYSVMFSKNTADFEVVLSSEHTGSAFGSQESTEKFVGLLKIDNSLSCSMLHTQSLGNTRYVLDYFKEFQPVFFPDFTNLIINNTHTSSLDITSGINIVEKINNIASVCIINKDDEKSYIAYVDYDFENGLINNPIVSNFHNAPRARVAIQTCDTLDPNKLEIFVFGTNKDSVRSVEHSVFANKRYSTYFADENKFLNNLEEIWEKQLYKNTSGWYQELYSYIDEKLFSLKEVLLDPPVDFCGTNFTVIKNYDLENNTISLDTSNDFRLLREYLANLNGFYGFSSWKQIHPSQNYFINKIKKQNKYSINDKKYLEPVYSRGYPLELNLTFGDIKEKILVDHLNDHMYFTNIDLKEDLRENHYLFYNLKQTEYEKYKSIIGGDFTFHSIILTENVYPKKNYLSLVRERSIYDEKNLLGYSLDISSTNLFWRDSSISRIKNITLSYNNLNFKLENITTNYFNAKRKHLFGNLLKDEEKNLNKNISGLFHNKKYSIWPLDNYFVGDKAYSINEYLKKVSGTPENFVLNNISSSVYNDELETDRVIGDLVYPGYEEERKLTYFIPKNSFGIKSSPRSQFIFNPFNFTISYEPYGLISRIFDISEQNPWYDSYKQYCEDIKYIGKEYSILPEFLLSNHISDYLLKGVDFINKNFLSLYGEEIDASGKIDVITKNKYLYDIDANKYYELNVARSVDISGNIYYNNIDPNIPVPDDDLENHSANYFATIQAIEDTQNLFSYGINLKNSVNLKNYTLPNVITKNDTVDLKDFQRATSLNVDTLSEDTFRSLEVKIKNINNQLSSSDNITSPNLITSSFGVSLWFKLSDDVLKNKQKVGLFSLVKSTEDFLFAPYSLGVMLNTSGSDLGDGAGVYPSTPIDTDIYVFSAGSYDNGISKTNIVSFYNNSSSISGNNDFLESQIKLDNNWHHLFLQYTKPQEFSVTPTIAQKQYGKAIYPRVGKINNDQPFIDLDHGYTKGTYTKENNFSGERKILYLGRESRKDLMQSEVDFSLGYQNYVATINVFNTSDDSSVTFDDKHIGISVYTVNGDKNLRRVHKIINFYADQYLTGFSYKNFLPYFSTYFTTITRNFTFVDAVPLGEVDGILKFAVVYSYRCYIPPNSFPYYETTVRDTWVNITEYVICSFDLNDPGNNIIYEADIGSLNVSAPQILRFDPFTYPPPSEFGVEYEKFYYWPKWPTSLSILPLDKQNGIHTKLAVNYGTFDLNGFYSDSTTVVYGIDYDNEYLYEYDPSIYFSNITNTVPTSDGEIQFLQEVGYFNNELAVSGVLGEDFFYPDPHKADKTTVLLPNDHDPESFIELYVSGNIGVGNGRAAYIINTNYVNGSRSFSDPIPLDTENYKTATLHRYANDASSSYYILNSAERAVNSGSLQIIKYNNFTHQIESTSSIAEYLACSNGNFFDEVYTHPTINLSIIPEGIFDTSISLFECNTGSMTINKIHTLPYTSTRRAVDTHFAKDLTRQFIPTFNDQGSSSFNVPFSYFDIDIPAYILTSIKVQTHTGSNAMIELYLDGQKKYGLNYNETLPAKNFKNITSSINNATDEYILDNQPYYEDSDPHKFYNNLDVVLLGQGIGQQFLQPIGFKGEIDEFSMWNGSYTEEAVKKIYNNGITNNLNYLSYQFNQDPSTYYKSTDIKNGSSNVTGNIFIWNRLGYPFLNEEQQITTYNYRTDFFEKTGNSDILSRYKENNVIKTHYEKISEDFSGSVESISLTVDGISKLLPYNGFYPAQRVSQIGKLFLESFGYYDQYGYDQQNLSLTDGDNYKINGGVQRINNESILQSLIQPFMAPGILFNSIKSGIAVDWPLFVDTSINTNGTASAHKPSFYVTSSDGVDLNRDGIPYVMSKTENTNIIRLPFESLMDINKFPKKLGSEQSEIIYMQNPTIYALTSSFEEYVEGGDSNFKLSNIYPYFIWNGTKNNSYYELAINNFIAETPRFFLEGGELTSFISKPTKELLPTVSGTLYVMDVSIYKDKNFDMIVAANEDTKGKYFGPPVDCGVSGSENIVASVKDPAYAPYTPSYYYGKSTLRLSYLADKPNTTIKEIISKLNVEEINSELDFKFDNNNLSKNSSAYLYKMPIASSIVYDQTFIDPSVTIQEGNSSREFTNNIQDVEQNRRWIITTKWESPVLNYNDNKINNKALLEKDSLETELINYIPSLTQEGDVNIAPIASTGLWSGYTKNLISGIKMSISNPFKEFYNQETNTGTSSLAELCGFELSDKKIGQIANKKMLKEAILAIPYYEKSTLGENDKYELKLNEIYETSITDKFEFFELDKTTFKKSYDYYTANKRDEDAPNTIVDMIKKMETYEIPPHMNFLEKAKINHFTEYSPFAMYIFEFSRELSQQDLADIWQGVLPDTGIVPHKDSITIEHKIGPEVLIKEIKYPKKLKWLIFKVKAKAEKYYSDLTKYEDERFNLLKTEKTKYNIGYNWPYDYCSLVELSSVNVKFIFKNKDEE